MKKFLLSKLADAAHLKPPGYLDLCEKIGSITGEFISFTDAQIEAIRLHFKSPNATASDCGCGKKLVCEFLKGGSCSLGFYGGTPKTCECGHCIAAGQNTEEFSRILQARLAASHPDGVPRVSGCCDSALDSPM
jgi:hypothetical protein